MHLYEVIRAIGNRLIAISEERRYRASGITNASNRIDCIKTIEEVLKLHQPSVLFDIGANVGQWTRLMSLLNPNLHSTVLFEPQKNYYKEACKLSLPGVELKTYQTALGSHSGKTNIYGGTSSASMLQYTDEQNTCFPGSIRDEKEEVEIVALDDLVVRKNLPQPDTAKLDVQGFEMEVFKGGSKTLSCCKCLIVELSFKELYSGQPKLSSIISMLESWNFELEGVGYMLRSSESPHPIVSFDGIFIQKK